MPAKTWDQYATDVAAGKIPASVPVRQACKRHLQDLKLCRRRGGHPRGLWFDAAEAERAIKFTKLCRHSKGEWAGQPLDLSPWQQFIVASLWGWRRQDGTRRFRVCYIEVPRKNGKSTMLSALVLLLLVADREAGAEIYCAATKRDQARIVFDEAQRMVKASPALSKRITCHRANMHILATASKCEPLSADADTLDGLNPHACIIDELHKHKTRDLWDVLDTATGARRQPLLIAITTAGDDRQGVCYEQHTYSRQVLDGTIEDDSWFAYIACLDEGDDHRDKRNWAKANPNLGVSVKLDDLERKIRKADGSPAALTAVLRLHFNVWAESAEGLLDMQLWRKCPAEPLDWEDLAGWTCFGGLDLASRLDIAALVLLYPPTEPKTPFDVRCLFWIPEDTARERSKRDRVPYLTWIRQGWIRATPGNVIDFDRIRADIVALRDVHGQHIEEIAIDPWNATQLATQLDGDGFTVVETYQGFRNLAEPTQELLGLVAARRINHGGNPVLTWMAGNVVPDVSGDGAMKPSKKKSREKIDGIVALTMALGRAMANPEANQESWGIGRL